MDPLLGLGLLFLLARKRDDGAHPWTSTHHGHGGYHPASHPTTGPAAFPSVPTASIPPAPSPSVQAGARWVPYVPLNQAVIDRANQLLHDSSMHVNQEIIEPDPASGGQMRYLKVNAPPGKISVTAWRPTLASPAPAAQATHVPSSAATSMPPGIVPASYSPAPAAAPPPASGRLLKRGMKGQDVARWQAYLASQGFAGIVADGNFGPKTDAATRLFQKASGLTPDGVVGPQTRNAAHLAAA